MDGLSVWTIRNISNEVALLLDKFLASQEVLVEILPKKFN